MCIIEIYPFNDDIDIYPGNLIVYGDFGTETFELVSYLECLYYTPYYSG